MVDWAQNTNCIIAPEWKSSERLLLLFSPDLRLTVFTVSVDGSWSVWHAWSACSVTCKGVGTRGRIRDCDNPTPLFGGTTCTGTGSETENCDFSLTLCSGKEREEADVNCV